MVRQLPPWFENLGKRQVKSPKIYVRDSGLLQLLLGVMTRRDLEMHPKVGAPWEGYALEEVLKSQQPDEAWRSAVRLTAGVCEGRFRDWRGCEGLFNPRDRRFQDRRFRDSAGYWPPGQWWGRWVGPTIQPRGRRARSNPPACAPGIGRNRGDEKSHALASCRLESQGRRREA